MGVPKTEHRICYVRSSGIYSVFWLSSIQVLKHYQNNFMNFVSPKNDE